MERSDSISLPSIEAQQPQGQVTDKNETKDNSQNAAITASQYPSGIKSYLAVATLCLAIFLVTLVCYPQLGTTYTNVQTLHLGQHHHRHSDALHL